MKRFGGEFISRLFSFLKCMFWTRRAIPDRCTWVFFRFSFFPSFFNTVLCDHDHSFKDHGLKENRIATLPRYQIVKKVYFFHPMNKNTVYSGNIWIGRKVVRGGLVTRLNKRMRNRTIYDITNTGSRKGMVIARIPIGLFLFITIVVVFLPDVSSSEPSTLCQSSKTCESCLHDVSCFWCDSNSTCQPYVEKVYAQCSVRKWKTCSNMHYPTAFLIMSGVVFVVFIVGGR